MEIGYSNEVITFLIYPEAKQTDYRCQPTPRGAISFIVLTLCFVFSAHAQQNVGIGTLTPDNSAILELSSTSRGLLIPRMTTLERDLIAGPADWLLIFNTSTQQFEYFNGTIWIGLLGASSTNASWTLAGNSGTTPGTNFLGTSDGQALNLRVNSTTTAIFNVNGSLQRDGGGNARGLNAIDLQRGNPGATQVASGDYAAIGGGSLNTADGAYSVVAGGLLNTAGSRAFVGSGESNAAGSFSAIPGGRQLTLGSGSFGFNGLNNSVNLTAFPNTAYLGDVDLWLGNNGSSASALRFFEPTSDVTSANYSSFRAQAQSGNLNYLWPSAAPTTTNSFLAVASIGADITLGWQPITSIFWSLSGNAVSSGSFLGTSNAEDLAFRTNNLERMRISSTGNVAVGTATPESSAQLEVNSTDKGFLLPRMTENQRDNIAGPVAGLMVYTTDGSSPGIYYFDGVQWIRMIVPNSIGTVVVKNKTSDESVVSSTTLQDDDDLFISLAANETWIVDGFLHILTTANQPDFKFTMTVPAGATMTAGYHVNENSTNILAGALTSSGQQQSVNLTQNASSILIYKVMIVMGGTAGDFQIQWAQDNSNGTAVVVKEGSFFIASRTD